MKNKSFYVIKIIFALSILQLCLYGLQQFCFLFFERTDFSDHMASMISMIILTGIIIIMLKMHKIGPVSVFPEKFSLGYIIFSLMFLVILILTPSNFSGSIKDILLLIYSSIVTPIYEEIIFRGIVWNKLEEIWSNNIVVYLINVILFGLWHLGYFSAISFRVTSGVAIVMIWKVVTGVIFGLVLGLIRIKSKNCFSTMLAHGMMNIFGR